MQEVAQSQALSLNYKTQKPLHNSFIALRQLKKKQHKLFQINNKMSILKAKQTKKLNLSKHNQQVEQFHLDLRRYKDQTKIQKQQYLKYLKQRIEQLKQRNQSQRKQSLANVQTMKQHIFEMKFQEGKYVRGISKKLQKSICEFRKEDIQNKRKMRNSVTEFEYNHRKHMIQRSQSNIKDNLSNKQQIKKLCEERASHIQSMIEQAIIQERILTEKNQQAQQLARKTTNKLQILLNPQRGQLSAKLNKNKSITTNQSTIAKQKVPGY